MPHPWVGDVSPLNEEERLWRAFHFVDKDNDGRITADELCEALHSLGEDSSDEDIDEAVGRSGMDFEAFVTFANNKADRIDENYLLYGPQKGYRCLISQCRRCCHIVLKPFARCSAWSCRTCCCYFGTSWEKSHDFSDDSELGSRNQLLHALGTCARLVGGTGYAVDEWYGKFDPPLNGRGGWRVSSPLEQVCEASGSISAIQAAMYTNQMYPHVVIVAYRGTSSKLSLQQDVSLLTPHPGSPIATACEEAKQFLRRCADELYPDRKVFVTGHSLGGYLAEVVASFMDVEGASFNGPGPWTAQCHPVKNNTGSYRPNFEVHLTKSDPLALFVFPKPQQSRHIATPHWHFGTTHRICDPYVPCTVDSYPSGVEILDKSCEQVDQWEALELEPPVRALLPPPAVETMTPRNFTMVPVVAVSGPRR